MKEHDIQMKKSSSGEWENLFPKTKSENVFDKKRNGYLDKVLDLIEKALEDAKTLFSSETNKIKNQLSEINVRSFGATGDGITDDTEAIQNAINSVTKTRQTIIFPPTDGGYYKVSELTIPVSSAVIKFEGIGDARIYFTGSTGFHIMTEYIVFENLTLLNITAQSNGTAGTTLFNDERTYKRLDFDLMVKDCSFGFWHDIVYTRGRGVNIDNCSFNDVTGYGIDLNLLNRSEVEAGKYDIQEFATGYRGYVIRNSRFHYCNSMTIMRTTNDTEKVVQGVQIVGNQIEGGLAYYVGYLRNSIIAKNNHYQADTNATLFSLTGAEDTTIDLQIVSMNSWKDNHSKFISRIVESQGKLVNVKITGVVQSLSHHAITLYEGASMLLVDLQIRHVLGATYVPSLLVMTGSGNYDGVTVKGFFDSKSGETVAIVKTGTSALYNLKYSELSIIGSFASYTNIG